MRYPVTADQVISPDDLSAGREYIVIHNTAYLREINAASYTGFLMAMCESKAEYEALDVMDRISAISMAIEIAKEFYSEKN